MASKYTHFFRRSLAVFLTLVMVFSMMNVVTFAAPAADPWPDQVMKNPSHFELKEDGSVIGKTDQTEVTGSGFTISKTAEQTGLNKFDITLKVSTAQTVTTSDAAIQLVIDVSGSMGYESGEHDETERLQAVQEAVAGRGGFLDSLVQGGNTGKIYVSVVAFSSYAKTVCEWTDITSASGMRNVKKSVNKLEADGGTNLDAGLMLARNRIKTRNEANKFVVLLTDGEPTYHTTKNSSSLQSIDTKKGEGNEATAPDVEQAAARANEIKAAGAAIYTIRYGDNSDTLPTGKLGDVSKNCAYCGKPKSEHNKVDESRWGIFPDWHYYCSGTSGKEYKAPASRDEISLDTFLKEYIATPQQGKTQYAFAASDMASVKQAFQDIAQSSVSGMTGEGTKVIDPMGEYVLFDRVLTEGEKHETTGDRKLLTWYLDPATARKTEKGGTTTYTYLLKYSVTLDVNAPGFEEGKYYPTNGYTYLDTAGNGADKLPFNVPGVKGIRTQCSVSVSKIWNDHDNQDGKRPTEITVKLLADGTQKQTLKLNSTNNWSGSFTGLDKFRQNGEKIVYTVEEVPTEGYRASVRGTAETGFVITNTHTPEKTAVSVTKAWNDGDNQDGIRPQKITVQLSADGVKGATLVLSESNHWTGSFDNLDKYAAGNEIRYTVEEIRVEGYGTEISAPAEGGFLITNTHAPETTTVSGSKTWNDADDQDGRRPDSITIRLLANGEEIEVRTVTANDNWAWSFENLPVNAAGEKIRYSIQEDAVAGYEASYDGFNVTNTHIPETITVSGGKAWADANNQDGKRPQSITVHLMANGAATESKTVTAADGWAWSFENLPKYENGTEIHYSITEDAVPGYTTTYDGYNVTNSYTPEKRSITVTKTWKDGADQDGIRPEEVTVQLLAEGQAVPGKTLTLNSSNWTGSFTDLDKYAGGREIQYSVEEVSVADGYTPAVTGNAENGFVVTNTHTPAVTSVSGGKTWNDADDQDGKRPDSITIRLMANGEEVEVRTVTANDSWAWTFENLPVNARGERIRYSIQEDAVTGYEAAYDGFNVTNTHTPETVTVSGGKTWNDANNQDGKRPAGIVIHLMANGVAAETKTVTANDNWTWTFANLPKYADGEAITYSIREEEVTGYETAYDGFNVTNTHTPETVTVSGGKTWNDANNQDGKRPAGIVIHLMANGVAAETKTVTAADGWAWTFADLPKYANGNEITYSIREDEVAGYETAYDGFSVTNTHTPETVTVSGGKTWNDGNDQDGKRPESIQVNLLKNGQLLQTKTVTAANGWTWTFADLPRYENGNVITYSITEEAVDGYSTVYEDFDIINTHTPGQTSVTVSKIWQDGNNQDGIRPGRITVQLLANGEKLEGKTLTLSADNRWTGSFTGLPEYRSGEKIAYTVEEVRVDGYTSSTGGSAQDGFAITNTHTPAKTSVSVSKNWNDGNNQDGIRLREITVQLYADSVAVDGRTLVLGQANDWTGKFADLPKFRNGQEIAYTVAEVNSPEGYTAVITGSAADGFVITNTHAPEKTEVHVSKEWKDSNNQDGIRPENVTVQLLANGEALAGKTLVLSQSNGWAGSFADLPKFRNGQKITYTVAERNVAPGYTAEVTETDDGFLITNTHTPETVTVSGSKTWDDGENQDGKRPEHITVKLLANGEVAAVKTVTANDNWSWSFEDLAKFENGREIVYSITENAVEGYSTVYDGFHVTNRYTPGKVSISVTKSWKDNNDQDGLRPAEVTIQLLANGEKLEGKTLVLNADNLWTATFADLPEYQRGQKIAYSVEEIHVEGYTTVISGSAADGFTVTNTHAPETVTVSGGKTWADADNRDGKRPESITIQLTANGEILATKNVTEADGWRWSFENLPKFKAGEQIVYGITENAVAGYETTYDGFNVTNTLKTTSVSVSKIWQDETEEYRPDSVTVQLYCNGEAYGRPVILNQESDWSYTWEHLPEMDTWTLEEINVPEYYIATSEQDGSRWVITNTLDSEILEDPEIPLDPVPQTGDNSVLWIVAMLLSGMGLIALTVTSKKREKI